MNVSYKDIKLNIEKVSSMQSISPEFLLHGNTVIEEYNDYCTENLIRRITAYVACSDEKTITTYYPDGLWENIKMKCFPKWLKFKYPIKFAKFTVKVKEVFPEYACLDKDNKRHLHFRIYEQPETLYCST